MYNLRNIHTLLLLYIYIYIENIPGPKAYDRELKIYDIIVVNYKNYLAMGWFFFNIILSSEDIVYGS